MFVVANKHSFLHLLSNKSELRRFSHKRILLFTNSVDNAFRFAGLPRYLRKIEENESNFTSISRFCWIFSSPLFRYSVSDEATARQGVKHYFSLTAFYQCYRLLCFQCIYIFNIYGANYHHSCRRLLYSVSLPSIVLFLSGRNIHVSSVKFNAEDN